MASNVKITLDAAGNGAVEIDGIDLARALRGFTLSCAADERPTLDLDFCISEIEITSMGQAENEVLVNIPDEVIRVLLLIGWQPPENDPRTYRVARPRWEVSYTPTRDEYCTCPADHDPFQMDAHHSTCYYEQNSPDAND